LLIRGKGGLQKVDRQRNRQYITISPLRFENLLTVLLNMFVILSLQFMKKEITKQTCKTSGVLIGQKYLENQIQAKKLRYNEN